MTLLTALTLGACASAPVPTAEKLARAGAALEAQDSERARDLAEQVQVDAPLAESKAEARKAERSAVALQDAARALRDEMARKTP